MMSNQIYIIIFLISVFVSAISQLLLKLSTKEKHGSLIKEYFNFKVIFAYALFFSSTLLTTLAYKGVSLSFGLILESTGYIYVTLLSYFILKEKINKQKIIGIVLIIVGVFIFGIF